MGGIVDPCRGIASFQHIAVQPQVLTSASLGGENLIGLTTSHRSQPRGGPDVRQRARRIRAANTIGFPGRQSNALTLSANISATL